MADELKTLLPWEEIQGILQCVNVEENNGIIVLDFGHTKISVPFIAELETEITKRIGQNISILRTDRDDKLHFIMQED